MKRFFLAVSLGTALLSACVDDREHDRSGDSNHHGATLPNDAYYTGVPLPFRTVADCLADGRPATGCTHAVALCESGAYGIRHGDVVTAGRYQLDDRHAVSRSSHHDDDGDHDDEDGEHADNPKVAAFDFDVEAGQLVIDPIGVGAIVWQPDVEGRWKSATAIDCAARPPRR